MGAVSYGQAGYVGTSMSVRARAAYESGEMPMSKWTRKAIISAIKDYCDDFDLAYDSNFGLDEDAVCADFPEMGPDQVTGRDEIGIDGLLEAKSVEAGLSEEVGLVRESGCR